jgi:hypothetical protein
MPLPGFIAPCLPTKALQPQSVGDGLHEINTTGSGMRLYSSPGNGPDGPLPPDRRGARPPAVAVLHHDGEAAACGDDGIRAPRTMVDFDV